MVEFGKSTPPGPKKSPRDYLGRREQRTLLIPVAIVGIAVIVGIRLADRSSYVWRLISSAPPPAKATGAAGIPPQPERFDTQLPPRNLERDQLPLGTVAIRQEQPAVPREGVFFPGVEPELLDTIRDFSTFRSAEHPAWFNLLGVLKDADPKALRKASNDKVGFTQIYQQPDIYRGQLVTIRGTIKRALNYDAPKNDAGIERYHQVWLFPEAPLSPLVFYVLELPEGFPSSRVPGSETEVRNITEKAEITGFFFKNWAYGTGARIESAPLLLAKSIDWQRRDAAAVDPPVETTTIGTVVFGSALLGILVSAWIYRASQGKFAKPLSPQAVQFQPSSLQSLAGDDLGPGVGNSLTSLADAERAAERQESADSSAAFPSRLADNTSPPSELESR